MVPKEYRIYLCTAAEVIKIRFSHLDAGGYKHTMLYVLSAVGLSLSDALFVHDTVL